MSLNQISILQNDVCWLLIESSRLFSSFVPTNDLTVAQYTQRAAHTAAVSSELSFTHATLKKKTSFRIHLRHHIFFHIDSLVGTKKPCRNKNKLNEHCSVKWEQCRSDGSEGVFCRLSATSRNKLEYSVNMNGQGQTHRAKFWTSMTYFDRRQFTSKYFFYVWM